MKEIILIGAGGHCNSCIDVIEQEKKYKIKGIIQKEDEKKDFVLGYPVIGNNSKLKTILKKNDFALVCVGQIKSPLIRKKIFDELVKLKIIFPTIISPQSYVSKHSQVDNGTIIMHGSIINSNVKIGKNTIINSLSLIEHDVKIGSHVHVSTGAKINGGSSIGSGSFIGSGSVVFQQVKIGENCIIPSGSVVKKDVQSNPRFNNETK